MRIVEFMCWTLEAYLMTKVPFHDVYGGWSCVEVEMCKTKRRLLKISYAWCLRWIHEDGAFGEVFIKHVLGRAIKKEDPLEEIKIVII